MQEEIKTKICTVCGVEKPISEFYNQKSQKDGKQPRCKLCSSAYRKQYYAENREQILVRQSAYAKSHPEVQDRGRKRYKETHAEEIRQRRIVLNARPERKEKKSRDSRRRKEANPLHSLFIQTRSRANRSGIPFDINESDLFLPDVCPIFGTPMYWAKGGRTDDTPSLDKLSPALGYIPGNIFVISQKANTIKSNGSADEHRKTSNWIEQQIAHPPSTASKKEFLSQSRSARDRVKILVQTARKRCRKSGITFGISEQEVVIPEKCPILGIPIIFGPGKVHDNSPSLDKIIPELGYVPGNVAVISWRANRIKNVGTAQEHRQIADWIDTQLNRPDNGLLAFCGLQKEQRMTQPNFSVNSNSIPATDYDRMSDAQIQQLINQAHQVKTGRMGRVSAAPPPPSKGYVDLDRLIEQYGSK